MSTYAKYPALSSIPISPTFTIVTATGGVQIGTGTVTANTLLSIQKNQNALTAMSIANTNSGASAKVRSILTSDLGSLTLEADSTGSGAETSITSDTGFTNGLKIKQAGSKAISFLTNSTTRLTISGAGVVTTTGNLNIDGAQAWPTIGTTLTPSGTTQTVDFNTSNTQTLDLSSASGDVTVTLSNGQNGGVYTIHIIQSSTARTVTFTGAKWPGGIAYVASTGSGAVDIVSFAVRGATYYGTYSTNFS